MLSVSSSEAWLLPQRLSQAKLGDSWGWCRWRLPTTWPPHVPRPKPVSIKEEDFLQKLQQRLPFWLNSPRFNSMPMKLNQMSMAAKEAGKPSLFSIRQRWALRTRISMKGGYWLQSKLPHIMARLLMHRNKQEQMVAFRMLDLYIYTSTRSV